MAYVNYDHYTVVYDEEQHCFSISYKDRLLLSEAYVEGLYENDRKICELAAFPYCTPDVKCFYPNENTFALYLYFRKNEADEAPAFTLIFVTGSDGVGVKTQKFDAHIKGRLSADYPSAELLPVCVDRAADDMRAMIGAAIQPIDHALYHKMTDTAAIVGHSGVTCLSYDPKQAAYFAELPVYAVDPWQNATIRVQENVLAEKYHLQFSPYNRNCTFQTSPVGWMTWYAVKFNACEETVLKNAEWQAKNLKDYGANTVWVDWEWYHEAFPGDRHDGVNSLQPDPKKYPHGMKYVADRIKEMGMVPALWIGYTNEPDTNEFIEKYPDMVLADTSTWCGHYYYDFTNPHYLNEYLPTAVANVHKWGYRAVKYDTIPISIRMHNTYRKNMYDQTVTVKEAYRNMIRKTREVLGEDIYMLSCAGANNASIVWASDMFNAARIGGDIFTWTEHLKNIGRIQAFYPLHNIQLHVDADNVVLRKEFNTFEQAKARATIISLLGLPMTFGDEFEVLSDERVNILKRSLPILDIHPKDLTPTQRNNERLFIHLAIAKSYEAYQVTGVYNLTEHDAAQTLHLSEDLHLTSGDYLVYDFFRDCFLGVVSQLITLELLPYEGRILALRPLRGVPQVVSTSRHITQGAAEITAMGYHDNTLTLTAELIAGDRYTVTVYVPNGYRLCDYDGFQTAETQESIVRLSVLPTETRAHDFAVHFVKD